ncbi:HEAT repeat-containing protein 4-like isoform X6 [Ruditapes philippinarum]|uniref:HEAT repeat-containing protein 4-like isoform X6 n=1 Tax=Ruditapes philippinarum TaxID=129788 RepID=UPI00295AE0E8|nr:HEAT repeat-containing protein 4-like isoform X6 [Ruditapes philippinarum]
MTTAERLKTPLLFPCAARVKVPQLGSEDSDLKPGQKSSRYAPETIVFRNPSEPSDPISKDYLKKVSFDLVFEEEVVKERCFHALPYDEKYLSEAFDIGDIVSLPQRAKIPVGRHNSRGVDVRHMPCNLTKSTKPHLKPLRRKITERAQQMHFEALKREELREIQKRIQEKQIMLERVEEQIEEREEGDDTEREGVFLTETKPEKKSATVKTETALTTAVSEKEPIVEMKSTRKASTLQEDVTEETEKRGNDWDAYLMSIISSNTANWIVYEKTPAGAQDREKLENLLKKWYGTPEHTDLVREDMSDNEAESEEEVKTPKKKWTKKEATLLQKVYNLEEDEPHSLDPYSDDNKAPFYRQPAGLRRARKHEVKEELGAINTTAANIEVRTFKPSPPPTLRDFMNPEAGSYILETDNMFQQEQLTGTEQVFDAFGDKSKILMETQNKYKKELQPGFPQPPEQWFPLTEAERQEQLKNKKKQRKHHRGHRRWKKLPEPIDSETDARPYGYDAEYHREPSPRTMKAGKRNKALIRAIDEWRTKWHLTGQFVDSTPDDLINDMADIQSHVRLKAIATCAKASDYKPPEDHGIQLDYLDKSDEKDNLPEKLFVALECLLEDPVEKVKTAAAITLYSLNRPSKPAEEILYSAMQSDNPVDRWAAAQCLAHYGVCDSDVVGEILRQVMTTEDTIKHERGISMLGILSITSSLVHSMVAEQLNSSSWRHKIIACKILPTLRGDINRDITNKLTDLMWNDWHSEVRRAAAQCLGKTGHGRDVHDDLRNRILEGDERIKLEALSKVGQLGIMTAKLLPAFLKCFEDEYVAIRSEVCITCGNIAIKDEEVIAKLIQLATFDNIWKIKALAFQALGKIGVITEQIVDCLLWAVRYEENPGVRAEACHTLKVLKVKTEEVADVIQDRYLVESNQMVRDELASTLKMFDISASEDMDMVAQIKKEVKKLCTRNIIASQITLNEMDQDKRENLARMIYESEKDMKDHEKPQEPMMERLRSMSQASSHKMKLESVPASPEPILRDTAFTPTADQELEAILAKEDLTSGKTSPTDTETPGTKSRATSASTRLGDEDEDEEEEEEEKKETDDEGLDDEKRGKSSEEDRLPSTSSLRSRSAGIRSEVEGEIVKATQDFDRPTSTVKFAETLEVADIPSRSMSSLGPSRMSLMDEHGKPSRTSMTTGTTGTEGMVFGRDAVVEREKINEEARNTFAVMDMRYKDMVQDLIDLDNAFELGLLEGDRQDFEKKIQSMRIIKTPPTKNGDKEKVELAVKKSSSGVSVTEKPSKDAAQSSEVSVSNVPDVNSEVIEGNKEVPEVKSEVIAGNKVEETKKDKENEEEMDKQELPDNKASSETNVVKSDVEIVVTEAKDNSDRSDS